VHSFVKHCLTFFLWPLYLSFFIKGPSWTWSYGSWNYNYLCNQCLSPLILWVIISIKARGTALCDKVCQWPATGQWFSPGPLVSCTNKTDRHNIAEILLKVVLNTIKQTNKKTKTNINVRLLITPLVSSNLFSEADDSSIFFFKYIQLNKPLLYNNLAHVGPLNVYKLICTGEKHMSAK
jgi:hypothetical protein